MSSHNVYFHGEKVKYFVDTPSYLELCTIQVFVNNQIEALT